MVKAEVILTRAGASIPELAREYGVCEALLYKMANTGQLPGARRLGKRFLIDRGTFSEWLRTGHGV